MTATIRTRQDYMAGRCSHREYYNEFVTPRIRRAVLEFFGYDKLAASYDKEQNLNTISLSKWDDLARQMIFSDESIRAQLKAAGDGMSLAGAVCILKEAARQAIGR